MDASARVINPQLYAALQRVFGKILIANQGQKAGGAMLSGGEYYRICCPHCGDKYFRLWISYLFGTGLNDGQTRHLFHCFNESCEKRGLDMDEYLHAYSSMYRNAYLNDAVIIDAPIVHPPGMCSSIASLPQLHPACQLFYRRGFDPYVVGPEFDISVCIAPNPLLSAGVQKQIRDRIIFPVKFGGEMKGWQARYIGPNGDPNPPTKFIPKYFTAPAFKKTQYLYNFDSVISRQPSYVIVVEGVFDAMRLPGSVASLGHTLSTTQINMLSDVMRNGTLILLFDLDADAETQILARSLSSLFTRFAYVRMPDARDPADWATAELLQYIGAECQRMGVPLRL